MKRGLVILAIVIVVVCGGGFFAFSAYQQQQASANKKAVPTAKVTKDDVRVVVVENGTIDAVSAVEVKSQVTGRLARLMVEEGDVVQKGQLIAVIDPQETELRVRQDAAQLRGARSGADRTAIEIEQRRRTALANLEQAKLRVRMLEIEVKTQPQILQAAVSEAQTNLDIAQADQRRLVESTQPNDQASARAALREAQANLENAQIEMQRRTELLQKGYIAQREVDVARQTLQLGQVRMANATEVVNLQPVRFQTERRAAEDRILSARAALTRAKANFAQAPMKQRELDSAREDVRKSEVALRDAEVLAKTREQNLAQIEQLESALENSQRSLNETEIRAPISGVVTKKGIQVGELATGLSSFGSGTTIVKIEDRNAMRVKLNMNEIDVAKLSRGMTATIDVDAVIKKAYRGKVTKIAPASSEAATGTTATDAVVRYQVEILLDDPDGDLRTGMSAKCSMAVIDKSNVLTLPVDFVRKEGRKSYVFLPAKSKAKDAQPEKVEVQTGAQSGARIEIISGVTEGAEVEKPNYDGPDRKSFIQFGGGDE
jgi:HlyD family secretion protein